LLWMPSGRLPREHTRFPCGNTMAEPSQATLAKQSREQAKRTIAQAFRAEFPTDTVDVSDGYQDNLHVVVVSRRFDGLSESDKQDLVWQLIDESDLTEDGKSLISLVMPLSPSELK